MDADDTILSDDDIIEQMIESTGVALPPIMRRDDEGRVNVLGLLDLELGWDLPADIARLEKLEVLTLMSCRLLCPELYHLPNLVSLSIANFKLLQDFSNRHHNRNHDPDADADDDAATESTAMVLANLRNLTIAGWSFDISSTDTSLTRFFPWISKVAPNLDCFKIYDMHIASAAIIPQPPSSPSAAGIILQALANPTGPRFRNSLSQLYLIQCGIDESILEPLLLNVIPLYPNLKSLSLGGNNIRTLQFLLKDDDDIGNYDYDCVHGTGSTILYSGLETLTLDDNPILKRGWDDREKYAIWKLLKMFPHLGDLSLNKDYTIYSCREYEPTMDSSPESCDDDSPTSYSPSGSRDDYLTLDSSSDSSSDASSDSSTTTSSTEEATLWGPQSQYMSVINRAGRVLIERTVSQRFLQPREELNPKDDDRDGTVGTTTTHQQHRTLTSSHKHDLPLSVWPLVLERTKKIFIMSSCSPGPRTADATAIYYLLRNGPVLINRPDFSTCRMPSTEQGS